MTDPEMTLESLAPRHSGSDVKCSNGWLLPAFREEALDQALLQQSRHLWILKKQLLSAFSARHCLEVTAGKKC